MTTKNKKPQTPVKAPTAAKPLMKFRFIFPVYILTNTPLTSYTSRNYIFEPNMAIVDGVLIPYTNIAQISPEEL